MEGQDAKLNRVGVAGFGSLLTGNSRSDDDIAELAGLILGRKRKNVRDAILPAVLTVEVPNGGVADERDPHLAGRASRRDGRQPVRQSGGANRTAPSVGNRDAQAPT